MISPAKNPSAAHLQLRPERPVQRGRLDGLGVLGIVLVEATLDLVEDALFVFGKRHRSTPLRRDCPARSISSSRSVPTYNNATGRGAADCTVGANRRVIPVGSHRGPCGWVRDRLGRLGGESVLCRFGPHWVSPCRFTPRPRRPSRTAGPTAVSPNRRRTSSTARVAVVPIAGCSPDGRRRPPADPSPNGVVHVERQLPWPSACPGWTPRRRAAGHRPTMSTWSSRAGPVRAITGPVSTGPGQGLGPGDGGEVAEADLEGHGAPAELRGPEPGRDRVGHAHHLPVEVVRGRPCRGRRSPRGRPTWSPGRPRPGGRRGPRPGRGGGGRCWRRWPARGHRAAPRPGRRWC